MPIWTCCFCPWTGSWSTCEEWFNVSIFASILKSAFTSICNCGSWRGTGFCSKFDFFNASLFASLLKSEYTSISNCCSWKGTGSGSSSRGSDASLLSLWSFIAIEPTLFADLAVVLLGTRLWSENVSFGNVICFAFSPLWEDGLLEVRLVSTGICTLSSSMLSYPVTTFSVGPESLDSRFTTNMLLSRCLRKDFCLVFELPKPASSAVCISNLNRPEGLLAAKII